MLHIPEVYSWYSYPWACRHGSDPTLGLPSRVRPYLGPAVTGLLEPSGARIDPGVEDRDHHAAPVVFWMFLYGCVRLKRHVADQS